MSFSLIISSPVAVTKGESAKEVQALRGLDGANWVEITPAERKSAIVATSRSTETPRPAT